jgi:hypothetical protein
MNCVRAPIAALALAGLLALAGCGGGSSSMNGSDASPDRASAPDVGPIDGGVDVVTDTGRPPKEAGGDAGCSPLSLTKFEPYYAVPVGPHEGACTDKQLTDVVDDCFAPSATMLACDTWVNATENAECLGCWSGPETNPTWTPIIYANNGGQEILIDVGGCIALADPSQIMCAKAIEYVMQCEIEACLPVCKIPADNDLTALGKCSGEADKTVCAGYVAAASLCETKLNTSPAGFCFNAFTDSSDLVRFFELSCGPVPTKDAGPPKDAAADATPKRD